MQDDMIYRQAAIDALGEKPLAGKKGDYEEGLQNQWERDVVRIKVLPSAQPEQRWIPTSERLPKVREWVLCQCRAGIMDVLRLTENGYWNKNYLHTEYMSGFVIAWMPLPKPWEEEQNERYD